jgi:hypothetical protein
MKSDMPELLQNLKFNFDYFDKKPIFNWATQRLQYHEVQEQIHDQIYYFTILLQKITPRPIKIAIFLPDIYPQKHQILLSRLIKSFEIARHKIDLPFETILKRNNKIIKNTVDSTVHEFIDWTDPTTLSKYDLVIVLCSNFSCSILNEIMAEQQGYERTVFFCNTFGVKLEKLQNVFRTDLMAIPKLDCVFNQKIEDQLDRTKLDMKNLINVNRMEFSFECIGRSDDIFDFTAIKELLKRFLIKLGYNEQRSLKLIEEEMVDDSLWVQKMRVDFRTRKEYEQVPESTGKKWE